MNTNICPTTAPSFDTPPLVALRTSGLTSSTKNIYPIFSFSLALSVFASKMYRRVALLILLITPFCHSQITSQSFESLCNHANSLFAIEQYEEAIAFYKQALALNPTGAHIFFNLGQALHRAKKYPEALYAYKKTVHYEKNHHRAYVAIAKLMIDVQQPTDAIEPLKIALTLDPHNTDAHLLLARVYSNTDNFNKAIDVIMQGLTLNPDDANLTFELANIYTVINRLNEALELYQTLYTQLPNNSSLAYNIAFTLKQIGHVNKALQYYNRTLELNPLHAEAFFGRGVAYLMLGDFEKGWQGYEARYERPSQKSLLTFDAPRWNGADIQEKTILLHAEQGLGDTFQFIRYAKQVKERVGPEGTVIVAVQKPLVTIIKRCPYIDQVIAINEPIPTFDAHSPLMSLPYVFKTRLDTIPSEHPYLYADEKLIDHWKQQLTHDKNFKIGICWKGNENYATATVRAKAAQKSVQLEQLIPLCTVPGTTVYSLQKTTGTAELDTLPASVKIITFDGDFDQSNGRFMDTAAVIKNLDLVITVDTSIGHLASGLGVPTWVMLQNPADWRWMLKRTDSPWYPKTRLFKQPTPGDWESVINEITDELKKILSD
jgi:tetratricopeptide (TPR) repeat protein